MRRQLLISVRGAEVPLLLLHGERERYIVVNGCFRRWTNRDLVRGKVLTMQVEEKGRFGGRSATRHREKIKSS